MSRIQFVGTGPAFLKQGIRAMEPVMEELLTSAKKEIHVAAYVFTPQAAHILNLIEEALVRGIEVTVVVNNLEGQENPIKDHLKRLQEQFRGFHLFDFAYRRKGQLHAKVIVTDRSRGLVGSANFTWSGLIENHELGVLVEGEVCWKLAQLIDSLAESVENARAD